MVARKQQVFTTEQVTRLLGLTAKKDEWRVITFAQGKEYGIKPSISGAAGSGSRRLYDLEDVCQLALALRLLETGLRSKEIGKIMKQVRKGGKLSKNLNLEETEARALYLAIVREHQTGRRLDEKRYQWVGFVDGPWELEVVLDAADIESGRRTDCDVIMVPIGLMFLRLRQRLEQEQTKERGD